MAGAFQSNAFQSNAFQTGAAVVVTLAGGVGKSRRKKKRKDVVRPADWSEWPPPQNLPLAATPRRVAVDEAARSQEDDDALLLRAAILVTLH